MQENHRRTIRKTEKKLSVGAAVKKPGMMFPCSVCTKLRDASVLKKYFIPLHNSCLQHHLPKIWIDNTNIMS